MSSDILALEEVVSQNKDLTLLRTAFSEWWVAYKRVSAPRPVSKGVSVWSAFKWVAVTLGKRPSRADNYNFPRHLAKEKDGSESLYFLSRVREYACRNLVVSVERLPFFVHSIALLDAYQLKHYFKAWKHFHRQVMRLQFKSQRRRLKDLFDRWRISIDRELFLDDQRITLRLRHENRIMYMALLSWNTVFKGALRERLEVIPHMKGATFAYWARNTIQQRMLRIAEKNAIVFALRRKALLAFRIWSNHLCKLAKASTIAASVELVQWLIMYIRIRLMKSLLLAQDFIGKVRSRAPQYVNHPHIIRFLREIDPNLFHDAASGEHKADSDLPRHLQQSLTALRKVIQVVRARQSKSRVSQLFLIHCGYLYHKYRRMLIAMRTWMLFVPQRKIDRIPETAHNTASNVQYAQFRSIPSDHSQLRKTASYFLQLWHHRAKVIGYDRSRAGAVRSLRDHRKLLSLFGGWLILTAKYQASHRAANRVLNNRYHRDLYVAFFAWRNQFERLSLLRQNKRQLLHIRDNEVQSFKTLYTQKVQHRHQSSILRTWALFVRDRQRGKKLFAIWRKHGNLKLLLFHRFSRWKSILYLDIIARCVQKLWRGYLVRCITHVKIGRYLVWYRGRIPSMFALRRRHFKRLVFNTFKLNHGLFKQKHEFQVENKVLKVGFRRLWQKHRKHILQQKLLVVMDIHYQRTRLRLAMKDLFSNHKRRKFIHQLIRRNNFHDAQVTLQHWKVTAHIQKMSRLSHHIGHGKLMRKVLQRLRKLTLFQHQMRWKRIRLKLHLLRPMFWRWRKNIRKKLSRRRELSSYYYRSQRAYYLHSWLQSHRRKMYYRRKSNHHLHTRIKQQTMIVMMSKLLGRRPGQLLRRHMIRDKQLPHAPARIRGRLRSFTWKGLVSWHSKRYLRQWIIFTRRRIKLKVHLKHVRIHLLRKKCIQGFRALLSNWREAHQRGTTKKQKQQRTLLLRKHTKHNPLRPQQRYQHREKQQRLLLIAMAKRAVQKRHNPQFSDRAVDIYHHYHRWLLYMRQHNRRKNVMQQLLTSIRHTQLTTAMRVMLDNVRKRRKKKLKSLQILQQQNRQHLREAFSYLRYRSQRILCLKLLWSRQVTRKVLRRQFYALRKLRKFAYWQQRVAKLKVIEKLRRRARHFLERLKLLVYKHRKRRQVRLIHVKDRKRLLLQFRRFVLLTQRRQMRKYIFTGLIVARQKFVARRALRYWRRWLYLKHQLNKIVRRFTLRPALRIWVNTTADELFTRRGVNKVQKKITRRLKRDSFFLWTLFATRSARLHLQAQMVRERHERIVKTHFIQMWLNSLDTHVLWTRYCEVVARSNVRLKRRCLREWHQQQVIQENRTWRSAQYGLRNWRRRVSIFSTLKNSIARAKIYFASRCATLALRRFHKPIYMGWVQNIRKLALFLRRKALRDLLGALRRWRRRVRVGGVVNNAMTRAISLNGWDRSSLYDYPSRHYYGEGRDDYQPHATTRQASSRFISTLRGEGAESNNHHQRSRGGANYRQNSSRAGKAQAGRSTSSRSVAAGNLGGVGDEFGDGGDDSNGEDEDHAMGRSLRHWHRLAVKGRKQRERKLKRRLLISWRTQTLRQFLLRTAFYDRLSSLHRHHLLNSVFLPLKQHMILQQRHHFIAAKTKQNRLYRAWKLWQGGVDSLNHYRGAWDSVSKSIFFGGFLRRMYFQRWMIRTTIGYRLGCRQLMKHGLQRWRRAFAARRFYRLRLLSQALRGFKLVCKQMVDTRHKFVRRRHLLCKTLCRWHVQAMRGISFRFQTWRDVIFKNNPRDPLQDLFTSQAGRVLLFGDTPPLSRAPLSILQQRYALKIPRCTRLFARIWDVWVAPTLTEAAQLQRKRLLERRRWQQAITRQRRLEEEKEREVFDTIGEEGMMSPLRHRMSDILTRQRQQRREEAQIEEDQRNAAATNVTGTIARSLSSRRQFLGLSRAVSLGNNAGVTFFDQRENHQHRGDVSTISSTQPSPEQQRSMRLKDLYY